MWAIGRVKRQVINMAIQSKLISIEEYFEMAEKGILTEDDRVELIRGVIVEKMTPNSPHIACVARLNYLFSKLPDETATIFVQSPILVPPNSVPEPDIALLKWRDDFYASKFPEAEDVLLLIEVSDSTLADDRKVKMPLYAEGGVADYWIVNIPEGVIEVYSDLSDGSYRNVRRVGRGETLGLPEGLVGAVAIDDILGKSVL
ncbi:MAG TPA: Uma2 family endonuclease [Chloroflexia bacterium]|nr:Uma2 family endonuclease [Chloroflexia bacterium]